MSSAVRRLSLAPLLAIACALPTGSAQAADGENIARAVIEQDGGSASDFAWDISRQRGGVVDQHNAAHAAARCIGCRATAIAFQIVLVSGAPSRVAPINEAVALNHQCTACTVAAEARQFVRVVDAPVRLTRRGRATLADVRRDLRSLATHDLPLDQLHQAIETQESRVKAVLANHLVLKSHPAIEADVLHGWLEQDADLG